MDMSEEMIRIVLDQYQSSFQCAEKVIGYLNKVHKCETTIRGGSVT